MTRCKNKLTLTLMLLAVLATFGWAGEALAQLSTTFELDSNAIEQVAKSGDDWDVVLLGGGGGSSVRVGPLPDPEGFTRFTQGSKDELDFSAWAWDDATSPGKDEITNGYAALYATGLTNLLYVGMDRFANNGSANNGVWFLQNPITLNPDGTISGAHTTGDILIVSEFTGGGGVVGIRVFRWVVSGGNVTTHLDSIPVTSTTGFAVVNAGNETAPWPYTPKFGSAGTFPAGSFFECGLDLGALGITNVCFSQVLLETRSSFSTSAELKDFLLGSFPIAPSVSVSSDTVCVGNSAQLCANVVGGVGPFNYTWTGPPGFVDPGDVPCFNASIAGTYQVVVGSGTGCADTASGVLVVNPNPTCSISNDGPFCPTSSNQHCGPVGMASYSWSISGDGSIVGSSTSQCVTIQAASHCGSYTLTLSITDANGCSNTCNKIINLVDTTPPVLSGCPSDASFQCYSQVPAAAVVTANDNCLGPVSVSFSENQSNPGSSCNNTITRTWTAVDSCGNQASCSQIITVNDNTDPVLSGCPSDASFQCYSQVPGAANVTATDNCDGAITPVFSETESNPGSSCNNVITRTWTATDICGNVASCTQIITVNDTEAPSISCPADQTFDCSSGSSGVATATDNCDPDPVITFVDDTTSHTCPLVIRRTWTATDICGNSNSCVQTIQVVDETPPSITCPGPVTVECFADVPPPDIGSVTASDNCGTPVVTFEGDVAVGTCPTVITRTYKATDACLNTATCTQIITVDDNTAPILSGCPGDASFQCYSQVPPPANVTANDNCDGPVDVQFSESQTNQGSSCNNVITRTWRAVDRCGNAVSCTQIIRVNDNTAPVLSGCPDNASFQCYSQVPPPANVTANDNCDGAITPVFSESQSNPGSNCNNVITRRWTATDACGNSASCSQIITVNDDTAPVLSGCPLDASVQCFADVPPPANVTANDNCDGALNVDFSENQSNPGSSCNNVITRRWTATDACGNSASCSQTITVNDDTAPVVSCPPNDSVECNVTPVFGDATASDNCDPSPVVTCDPVVITPGPGPNEFTHTRTCRATDACGNVSDPCVTSIVVLSCGFEGCTPGFWKNHTELWNSNPAGLGGDAVSECVEAAILSLGAPYSGNGTTSSLFRTTFGLSSSEMTEAGLNANLTLLQAINLGGGGFQKLARHAVAGLLSSCQVNYTFSTVDVLTDVHDAIINLEAEPLATQLAAANELNHDFCESGHLAAAPVAPVEKELIAVQKAAGSALPTEFALLGSYPNPFNASTQINFALPQAGNVKLTIYNILGQSVRTLLDGEQPAGERSVLWNGTDNGGSSLSSGIYFYKVSFGGQVKVGRMNLLK